MKTRFAFLTTLTLLAACSTETLIDTAFPGRERFAFQTADGDSVFQYACESRATETATKANAKAAHVFADKRFTAMVDVAADRLLAGASALSISRYMDVESERLVDDVETRFQCLAYDFRDA